MARGITLGSAAQAAAVAATLRAAPLFRASLALLGADGLAEAEPPLETAPDLTRADPR